MPTELASAYVQIVPSADGIEKKIENVMGDGDKIGQSFGSKIGGGIGTALKTSGAILAGLGAAATVAAKGIWDAANATAETGDLIDKSSQKMGVSAEEYQALSYAAEHSGISIGKFQSAAAKVQASGFDGSVYDYVESLQAIEDPAERAAEAQEVLGERLANELNPLINGTTSMEEYRAQLEELGGVMSNDAVSNSAAFEDALTDMNTAMNGFKNTLMSGALPGLTLFVEGITGLVSGSKDAKDKLTEGANEIVSSLTAMIPQLITFIEAVGTAILEAAPTIISQLAEGIISALPGLADTLIEVVMSIVENLIELLPRVLEAGIQILEALINGITSAIPELLPAILDVILNIVDTLIQHIPDLLQAAITFFMAIVDAVPELVMKLIKALPEVIDSILNALTEAIPMLLEASIQLFMTLVECLPDIINALIEALPLVIDSIINFYLDNMDMMLDASITLLMAIVDAIPEIITALVKALPKIVKAIANGLKEALPKILEWGTNMAKKAKVAMGDIMDAIKEKFAGFPDKVKTMGKDLVEGLWNGISNAKQWIKDKISGWVDGVVDDMKDFFGIHSPSRLMRDEIGINIAYGVGEGFDEGMDDVNKNIDASLQRTYSLAPAVVNSYDYESESVGSEINAALSDMMSQLQTVAQPIVEVVYKSGTETLYKQVLKGKRTYEGRYNVVAEF